MLKIGTRGSKLALWQAEFTQAELRRIGVESTLVVIKTEGKGFFTKEIEDALLHGKVDLAVHAMNDIPASQPEGLVITAVSYRDNPADLLLIRPEAVAPGQIFKVKAGATVGAPAAHCQAQMRDFRPDVELKDLRGNILIRLEQLRAGDYDAVFLPAAGVKRLNPDLGGLVVVELNPREFIPAPAQGVVAWQTHRDDIPTRQLLKQIHHPETSAITNIERKVLQLMDDDRQLPLGVYAERDAAGNYHVFAACEIDGKLRRTQVSQSTSFGIADKIVRTLKGDENPQ